ncbi:MAG: mechanosensitive ion channel family protein [Chroococcidiopsidaceae cyanobacterium CP_BM_ER_R8_30]|nr:mechanosensitive ion channel family protein [Chroococcidiopsidaceae cyanobacterium CP_BM_ER_R8_30]
MTLATLRPFLAIPPRFRIWLVLFFATLLLTCIITPLYAQESNPAGNPIDGYPVTLDGQVLFTVRQGIPGTITAAERAKVINERLLAIAHDEQIAPESIRVEEQDNTSIVIAGHTLLLTVLNADRQAGQSRQQLAKATVQILKPAITEYRDSRSARRIVQGILFATLSTIALLIFLLLLQRLISTWSLKSRAAHREHRLGLRIQNFQLLGSDATIYLLEGFLQFLKLVLTIASLYLYIPFLLKQFPATRPIGNSISSNTVYQANQLINGFVYYLPKLAIITIVVFFTYFFIQFAKLVISELGRDDIHPWFYPEWIQPTKRLVTMLLIAGACVIAAPYLPGFGSPAFEGISIFLGALLTLGSSSVVANTISGIVLIYTRAFRIGDIIRIGDVLGEVIEKSLFVTRILTFRQEVITIPNQSLLNGQVINYSAITHEANSYLILSTIVTMGYDLSWRKAHEVLIDAAKVTAGIVPEPHPYVLQTALNDYNVSYELHVYTNHPEQMLRIYSELHQNIQDHCNQAGIELLSPAFSALRDGNHSTIPADYLPKDYRSPGFQIQNKNNH